MSEATKHAARTVLQSAVAFAVALPALVGASHLPTTLPWVAGGLAAAGALTRVMAVPAVQRALPAWLRTDGPPGEDASLRALATIAADRTGDGAGGGAGGAHD
jgi:hypothetical protein